MRRDDRLVETRDWSYPKPVAAMYLCALPLAWISFVGSAICVLFDLPTAMSVFAVLFGGSGFVLVAVAFYLLIREPELGTGEGSGLFVSSWPLPRGWRASWGRVILGKEVMCARTSLGLPRHR